MASVLRKTFLTNDGVTLSYLEGGGPAKKPLVILPGWSQSAEVFKFVLDGLCAEYHVFVIDHRGHGESEKPVWGYRISRLAKDFDDFLRARELEDVAVLGHSMGCAVLWCYIDLFGQGKLSRLILNDQRAVTLRDSEWPETRIDDMGATIPPEELYGMKHALGGKDALAAARKRLQGMTNPSLPADVFDWLFRENLKMPREAAARLLYNNWVSDWSDLIPRIKLPVLLIGGKASSTPWKCLLWQNKAIAGSRLEIFEQNEGGSHFIFVENPEKFLRVVCDFLG